MGMFKEDWQEEFRHGTLQIHLDTAFTAQIDRLRKRYDPRSHSYETAHVTLTKPFKEKPNEAVLLQLAELLSSFTKFPLEHEQADIFDGTSIVKINIKPKRDINSIRTKLQGTGLFLPEDKFPGGFQPHMTIFEYGNGTDAVDTIVTEVNTAVHPGIAKDWSIVYVKPDDKFCFSIVRELFS